MIPLSCGDPSLYQLPRLFTERLQVVWSALCSARWSNILAVTHDVYSVIPEVFHSCTAPLNSSRHWKTTKNNDVWIQSSFIHTALCTLHQNIKQLILNLIWAEMTPEKKSTVAPGIQFNLRDSTNLNDLDVKCVVNSSAIYLGADLK